MKQRISRKKDCMEDIKQLTEKLLMNIKCFGMK